MKFAEARPYADPEAAARKLIEIANSVEAVQDGRIYIELINGPFLFDLKAMLAEYSAGLKLAIERGWIELDRSGTFVRSPRPVRICLHERGTARGRALLLFIQLFFCSNSHDHLPNSFGNRGVGSTPERSLGLPDGVRFPVRVKLSCVGLRT
jgi:hypothetical protein